MVVFNMINVDVRAMPPRVERSQLRWLGHLISIHPKRVPVKVSQAPPCRRWARGRLRTCWRDYISHWAWCKEKDAWATLLDLLLLHLDKENEKMSLDYM